MSTLTLLGPQRLKPTLAQAVSERGVRGRIATITAGWQEREPEDQELDAHLSGRTFNLSLYRRAEEVHKADPELDKLHRERQDRLRELQRLYRMRLSHALDASRELVRLPESQLQAEQLTAAIEATRALDAEHLRFVEDVHTEYARKIDLENRPAVQRKRKQVRELLESEGAEAVAVAGGHVAVLLNRLRLFDLPSLLTGRHLFAWSAGAMATSGRIVLFHDSPPQGPGNAEVLESGVGLHHGIIPLPHAGERLLLDDRHRVSLFSRRFAPDMCVALEQGDRVDWTGHAWEARSGAVQLASSGALCTLGGEELPESMLDAGFFRRSRRVTAAAAMRRGTPPATTDGREEGEGQEPSRKAATKPASRTKTQKTAKPSKGRGSRRRAKDDRTPQDDDGRKEFEL